MQNQFWPKSGCWRSNGDQPVGTYWGRTMLEPSRATARVRLQKSAARKALGIIRRIRGQTGRIRCALLQRVEQWVTSWRNAFAGQDVRSPFPGVVFRVGKRKLSCRPSRLLEDTPQKRPTPSAAGTRPKALRKLTSAPGFRDPYKLNKLAKAYVKTEANLVVQLHRPCPL